MTGQTQHDHHHHHHHHHGHGGDIPPDAETATDPVCGMTVEVTEKTRTESYDGQSFHFCSDGCQEKFRDDPYFYASGNAEKAKGNVAQGTQWTCPMHPEIIRDEPGACPICGMALEPMMPSDEPSEELTDFTRRLWVSAAAAMSLSSVSVTGNALRLRGVKL